MDQLFYTCALCNSQAWRGKGCLAITLTEDRRIIIRVQDGTKSPPWLELLPDDIEWFRAILDKIKE